jgi:hypothetical protein
VKTGSNSSNALNGTETALDPKVKDELIKHLYLEECMFGLMLSDVRYIAFQIAEASFRLFFMFAEPPFRWELRGLEPWLSKGPQIPDHIFRIHHK